MELVTNIVNMKRTPSVSAMTQQAESRVLERVRMANARMKRQLALAKTAAPAATSKPTVSEEQLTSVKGQLAAARRTISELEQKIKSLTISLNDALTKNTAKKDKKNDFVPEFSKDKVAAPTIKVSSPTITVSSLKADSSDASK